MRGIGVRSWGSVLVCVALGCGGGSGKPSNRFIFTSATGGSGGSAGGGAGGAANPLANCGQLEPCGGNVVGTWNLAGGCVNETALTNSAMIDGCPGVTLDVANFTVSGTISLAADMTYSAGNAMESFTMTESIPASCLMGATCSDLSDQFRLQVQADPMPGLSFVSCTGTSTCACRFDAALLIMGETGKYATSGNSLLTTAAGATAGDSNDYCVQGSTMHLIEVDATMHMGPMGQATIVTDIVAQKQ